MVLVRVPVPGNPAQVWGARTAAFLLGALLVSAALLYPLSRSITRPLERLTAAAESFGKGDLARRSGFAGDDEVGRLARSFDEMAARIERARRAEKELLANVSHELRTPLARLTVALELIEPPEGQAGEVLRKRLAGLSEEITELGNLVSDVLTQSRLELAELPLTKKRVAVRALLERCRERALALEQLPIALEAPEALTVDADEALLKRIIDNLIDNARKYAASPGGDATVSLSARADAGQLVLTVSDRGPGFPLEDLSHVFDPFFRGQNAGGRTGGYGLGLALAKRVAEAHGGSIEARNRAGGGAEVELRIPGAAG
jgi:signal transduction histidine kinase